MLPVVETSWFGYSVGHWEQDRLIVTSTGFNDSTWLGTDGFPRTEALRLTDGRMEVEFTIDDPKAYTQPFSVTVGFDLVTDT